MKTLRLFSLALFALSAIGGISAQSTEIATKTTATQTLTVETREKIIAVHFTREEVIWTYAVYSVLPNGKEHLDGTTQVIRSRAAIAAETVTQNAQQVPFSTATTILVKFGEKFKAADEAAAQNPAP
jgi:hypothetical protein